MSNYFNKYWILIIAILLLCFISGGVLLIIELSRHQPVEITLDSTKFPDYSLEVFIDGAVAKPGYYPAKEADTLGGVIQSAGLISDAKLDHIKIYVPRIQEVDLQQKPQKVSLNRAEVWLFEALPGIGPSKAQAIVDYRNKYGYFHSVEDLLKVNGISKTLLDTIRNLIVIED